MTITVEVRPEVQAALARQAAEIGVEVGAYAATLLEEAAHLPSATDRSEAARQPKDMVELFAPLRGFNLVFERDRDPGRDIDL